MKIPTFIAKKNIPLTKEDVAMFEEKILDLCKETGLTLKFVQNTLEEIFNPKYPNANQNLTINAKYHIEPNMPIIGLSISGARVKFEHMDIGVHKQVDENGVCQFAMWIYTSGKKIPFGSKTQELLTLKEHFQYGTDIDDFDLDIIAKQLVSLLTMQKISKTRYRKVVESLECPAV